MKNSVTAPLLLCLLVCTAEAGLFGPGPWSQGAYYPGQLDGKYAASVTKDPNDPNPTPVGGVIGFALQRGRPSYLDSTTTPPSTAITVDPRSNYYAIFVGGQVFTGATLGFIDFNNNTVTGSLVPTPGLAGALAQGGGFLGAVTGNKSIFTFNGTGTIGPSPFLFSGIKTSDFAD
jgi:hypothetical protein